MISNIVAQATTPDIPGASPLTYVVVLVGAVLLAQRVTDVDLFGWVPSFGGGGGGSSIPMIPGSRGDPGFGLGRPRTIIIAIIGSLAAAIFAGVVGLPAGARVPIAATLTLTATYLSLRGLGSYSFSVFALVGGAVVVLGLSALGEPLIGALVNSRVFPIIAIGGLYLGYRAVQKIGSNEQPRRVYIRRRGDE